MPTKYSKYFSISDCYQLIHYHHHYCCQFIASMDSDILLSASLLETYTFTVSSVTISTLLQQYHCHRARIHYLENRCTT